MCAWGSMGPSSAKACVRQVCVLMISVMLWLRNIAYKGKKYHVEAHERQMAKRASWMKSSKKYREKVKASKLDKKDHAMNEKKKASYR